MYVLLILLHGQYIKIQVSSERKVNPEKAIHHIIMNDNLLESVDFEFGNKESQQNPGFDQETLMLIRK